MRNKYGEIEVITDEDEELVRVTESDWYRSLDFTRQNISNMENGHRSISKNAARALAELFDFSVEKFL
jgi:plasmid maintenance system antidote protein VapI